LHIIVYIYFTIISIELFLLLNFFTIMSNIDANLSKLVFLSDCTPVYYILGAPSKITQITLQRINGGVILTWYPPENSNAIPVTNYIIRYGKTGDPPDMINGYVTTSLATVTITGLLNGVSYRFWVSASNNVGEGVLSDPQSIDPGAAPEPISIVRRSYHSTTSTPPISNLQKVGIEFVPPLNYNGRAPTTYTITYSLLNNINAPVTTLTTPVNDDTSLNEIMVDQSSKTIYNMNGIKGNYVRRVIDIPNDIIRENYIFTVYSTNIYGRSSASLQTIIVHLDSSVPRFIAPSLTLPSDDIIEVTPGDKKFTFKWKQTTLPAATDVSGVNWKYRIQYTDDNKYWYYPNTNPIYREFDISYDNTKLPGIGVYSVDISRNVMNGTRYYVRYCIVNPEGDTSQYTLSDSSNINITSIIPGILPNPPDIFNATVGDRSVNLYFSWNNFPPGIDKTGGYPILDYRIDRYEVINGNIMNGANLDVSFSNITGPFFSDINSIRRNGTQYQYRIYTRTALGLSTLYRSVIAIPVRQSDIVYDVSSNVNTNSITLQWKPPIFPEPGMPIVQYHIQYRIFDLSFNGLPPNNIIGTFTTNFTVNKNINDMNSILVNDDLWSRLRTTIRSFNTGSNNLSYTITDLVNLEAYVFRIAAITQDSTRRNLIGLIQVIGNNSPYLRHPTIIGKIPSGIATDSINFINGDRQINILWSSADILNIDKINNFIVDYSIYGSNVITTRKFTYNYCISYYTDVRVYFSLYITGLSNNINTTTNSHSYDITIYAENTVGYTNISNRLRLNDLTDSFNDGISDQYENISNMPRYVRPGTIPSIIL
jgi:hypothetical protein